jgi:hypothetical protein
VDNAPNGQLSTTNCLQLFDPFAPTTPPDPPDPFAQSNFGTGAIENLVDNCSSQTVSTPGQTVGPGILTKRFIFSNGDRGTFGLVAPDETFTVRVDFNNNTGANLTDFFLCDVIDNTKYNIVGSSPAAVFTTSGSGGAPVPQVSFATGYSQGGPPTGPTLDNLRIRNECSTGNWRPIGDFYPPNPAPPETPDITKFRAYYPNLPAGAQINVIVNVKARNADENGQPLAPGTVFPNFAVFKRETNADYTTNNYSPNSASQSPSGNIGARVILARAEVRIVKATENNNTANSIETASENGIGFVLRPTVTTTFSPGVPVPVKVIDVLPVGLYRKPHIDDSTPLPNTFSCADLPLPDIPRPPACVDNGQQVLIWDLGLLPPNTPVPPIIFRVTADLSVFNNQVMTNTAIVSSPADPSLESVRTATRNIIGATPSTFMIYKKTATPQIDVNGTFVYEISYTNASFVTNFTGMDFIDILPFHPETLPPQTGDGTLLFGSGSHTRTPASDFIGDLDLDPFGITPPVSASTANATWYFTDVNPRNINLSPKHITNTLPGIWCAGVAQPNGTIMNCPLLTPANITAIRMKDNVPLPRDNTVRTFSIRFKTNNNEAFDVYTNNSGGSVTELVLPVSSINVPVVVRDGAISGMIWYDTDADGLRDAAETGRVRDITVKLDGTTNGVHRSMTTDPAGLYKFNALPGGTYKIKFNRPINYRPSPRDNPSAGDGADSDGDEITLTTDAVGVGQTTVDQGFYQLNLGGTVFNDANNDGDRDANETVVRGPLNVRLFDDQDNEVDHTTTDTFTGKYNFTYMVKGDYRVQIDPNGTPPSAVWNTTPNDDIDEDNNGIPLLELLTVISNPIHVEAGTEPVIDHSKGVTTNPTLDFGLFVTTTSAAVAVGGRVVTADGRGIGKALVTMTGTGGTVYRALTNPFGYYRFDNVAAGTTVLISVSSKSYTFEVGTRVISVSDELMDVNFIAIE